MQATIHCIENRIDDLLEQFSHYEAGHSTAVAIEREISFLQEIAEEIQTRYNVISGLLDEATSLLP